MGLIKLCRSLKTWQIRREVQGRFNTIYGVGDVFLERLLSDLRGDAITVSEFLKKYAERDAKTLQICKSFDNIDDYIGHLNHVIIKTKKYDWELTDIFHIDILTKHEQDHVNAAAEFGVKTKFVFYNRGRHYGPATITLNLCEAGKDWTLQEFENFWYHFVTEVHEKNIKNNPWKKVDINEYQTPVRMLDR